MMLKWVLSQMLSDRRMRIAVIADSKLNVGRYKELNKSNILHN